MPPSIETNRLLLRPFTPDDAEALHAQVFGDPDVMEFLPGGIPRTLKQTERVIEYYTEAWKQYGYGVWAATLKDSGVMIGQAGLNFVEDVQQTEVLFAIGKAYWGKGYAPEAAQAAMRFGFHEAGLGKIVALVALENERSLNVIKKLGMQVRRDVKLWKMKLKMFVMPVESFVSGDATFIPHD